MGLGTKEAGREWRRGGGGGGGRDGARSPGRYRLLLLLLLLLLGIARCPQAQAVRGGLLLPVTTSSRETKRT